MIKNLIRYAERHLEKRVIMGCDADDTSNSPLLTRYFVFRTKRFGSLYLHVFHRSDEDRELHDHPWNFASLVLANGYIEQTDNGRKVRRVGSIVCRPAHWRHRVELINDKPAVTLFWVSRRVRTWGFHTLRGWVPFQQFFDQKGCWNAEFKKPSNGE